MEKMEPKGNPNGGQNASKMFKRSRLKAKGPQNEPKRPEIWHVKNDEENVHFMDVKNCWTWKCPFLPKYVELENNRK